LHGNQTIMEDAFNGGTADWEITRYAGVEHGYTSFGSAAYNLMADARSWESMLTTFKELLAVPQQIIDEPTPAPAVVGVTTPAPADVGVTTPAPVEDTTTDAPTADSSTLGFFVAFAFTVAAAVMA
jgi:hypothetical protein